MILAKNEEAPFAPTAAQRSRNILDHFTISHHLAGLMCNPILPHSSMIVLKWELVQRRVGWMSKKGRGHKRRLAVLHFVKTIMLIQSSIAITKRVVQMSLIIFKNLSRSILLKVLRKSTLRTTFVVFLCFLIKFIPDPPWNRYRGNWWWNWFKYYNTIYQI